MSVDCGAEVEFHMCLICDEKFEKKDALKLHLLIHTNSEENFALHPTNTNKFELFDYKDLLFINDSFLLDELNLHNQLKEVSKFKEVHVCSTCGKEFRRKDHLNKHTAVHSGERPFVCLVCGKDFSRKDRLKDHCVMHLSNGWSCYFCGRMFSQRCVLRKHEMIHRGVKPFSCKLCDRKFSRKNDLLRHGTSHTGEKTHFCEVCGKGFSQKRLLKRHLHIHTRLL
ncbi:gastrula zinc finger protein XlCGF49.1-like [Argiope bruennichi]|uniref:gastrula zinc finger protein XlCGF49.1-like n=1 Tax=Argiope bruennichi TaxID=94029 RepID=UPI0024956C08|nr:gastrula zinc finger protein XlCGF49.1-like [Argiope bruennichi]